MRELTPTTKVFVNKYLLFNLWLFFSFSILLQEASAQKPAITSFLPTKGPAGSQVIITGSNFSPVAANNTVLFGDVRGIVTMASTGSLSVVVPAGATYKPLSVITNGLVAYSAQPFSLMFPGASSSLANQSFAARFDSVVGANPFELEASDFNGDGLLDLVTAASSNNRISILKNSSSLGTIVFQPRIDVATGTNPVAFAIGDIDGDTRQDIVTVNSSASSLSVLRNSSTINTISFVSKLDLLTGSFPAFCAIGDVDGDGKPDIVCTNSGSNTISVFRNTGSPGNPAFAPKIDYLSGNSPSGIAITDIDGDGLPEIVVANTTGNSISVYKNQSTPGTVLLDAKTDFTNQYQPTKLFAADMDGDGKVDFVAGSNGSVFSVLRNRSAAGTIQFDPASQFSTGIGASQNISLGDVNGDGKVDVAANHYLYSQVSLVKNESTANTLSFAGRVDYTASSMTAAALLADLDLDGKPDLTTANHTGGSVSVFKNIVTDPYIVSFTPTTAGRGAAITVNGNNFNSTTAVRIGGIPASSFVVESSVRLTAIVDTGASGDVMVTNQYGTGKLSGFSFNRIPTIQSFTPATGSSGTSVTIEGTNFNGTTAVMFGSLPASSFNIVSSTIITAIAPTLAAGTYDITVTNAFGAATSQGFYTGLTVQSFFPTSGAAGSIIKIQGTNFNPVAANNLVTFGTIKATVISATSNILAVVVPTGTGYQPITVTANQLTAYSSRPFSTTFRSTCNGFTNTSFVRTLDSSTGSFPVHASIADLNSDGKPDVVVSNFASRFISVSRNTSTGNIPAFGTRKDFPTIEYPVSTSVGDFDGDGKPDIFLLTTQAGSSLQRSFFIFRNTSTGDSIYLTRSDYAFGILNENPEHSAVADFNGDGKPDVAVLSSGTVSVLKNTSAAGSISFAPKVDFSGINLGRSLQVTDVDRDGKPDMIISNYSGDRISMFRNISVNGQILFEAPVYTQTGFSPESASLGDFNNDGKPDVAIATPGNNSVSVHKNNSKTGKIAFEPRINFPLGAVPNNIMVNDLDGDGRLDLALATRNNESVSILRNTAANSLIAFDNPVKYGNNFNFTKLFTADFSGDGKADLLTTNGNGTSFSIFMNLCPDESLPEASITAITPTEFCDGDSTILKTPAVSGATYQWYKEGTAIASVTDSVFSAKESGRYSVRVTLNNTVSSSVFIVVTKKALPPIPLITGAGNGSFTTGTGMLLYSSEPTGNQWYQNNFPLPNRTDSTLYVFAGGVFHVVVNNNGCLASSAPVTIVVVQRPAFVLCPNNSDSIPAGFNGASYQWQADAGTGFVNIADNAFYSGTNSKWLKLSSTPSSLNGYKFRCLVGSIYSDITTIKIQTSWQGTVSTQWENPLNWSCGLVPDAYTDVIIGSGTVVVNANTTIKSLTISPGANLTVATGVTLTVLR